VTIARPTSLKSEGGGGGKAVSKAVWADQEYWDCAGEDER
jgi:hypothetical protein